MYCPIQGYRKPYQSTVMCFEDRCAWWDEVRKQCIITTLVQTQSQNLPVPVEKWNQVNPPISEVSELTEFLQDKYNFEVKI